jgi:DNA invertase Pin-like site-specific DNA recombinase
METKDNLMASRIYAYARVSTQDQKLDLQLDALKKHGYDELFQEKISGKKTKDRPALLEMLSRVREDDLVLIYKFDRLSRSMRDLVSIAEEIKEKKAHFKSLSEEINTCTPMGNFFFNVTSSFAQLERDLISERTKAGLKAARERGRKPGRKKGMSEELKLKCESVYAIYQSSDSESVEKLCKRFNLQKSSFYRWKVTYIDSKPEQQIDAFTIR